MTDIPSSLKTILIKNYNMNLLTTEQKFNSKVDDTIKYLFKTKEI